MAAQPYYYRQIWNQPPKLRDKFRHYVDVIEAAERDVAASIVRERKARMKFLAARQRRMRP